LFADTGTAYTPPRKIHRIGEDVSFFILIYFE
jgi:hypothetical protein